MDENQQNSIEKKTETIVDGNNNEPYGQPGKGQAIASMVLGIVSVVFWFFGAGAIVGLVTGIIGIIMAESAKKKGYVGGMRTAGLVCSIIGLVGSALVFLACVACASVLGTAGAVFK